MYNFLRQASFSLAPIACLLFSTFAFANPPAVVYPLMGPRLSSEFGTRKHPVLKVTRHHHGVDLAAPNGSPVRAIAAGQVIYADPFGGYGKFIVIKHINGLTSHYGHCSKLLVQPGETVKPGQLIAQVGSTGISTGPHLHFEVRKFGQPQDPEKYLPGLDQTGEG